MDPTVGEPKRDSMFRFEQENITEKDAEGRFNYRKADYRNYQDGDKKSAQKDGLLNADPNFEETASMYVFKENDYEEYLAHMPIDKLKKDQYGNPLKNKKNENYYKNTWRTFQMSDHLPMWVELEIDFSEEYLKKLKKKETS